MGNPAQLPRTVPALPGELLLPIPRRVHQKRTARQSAFSSVLATAGLALAAVALISRLAYLAIDPFVFFRSPTTAATFVGEDSHWGGKAGQVDRIIYRYRVGGGWQVARERVPAGMYGRIGSATPLRVRLMSFAGWHDVRLDRGWADYADGREFDWFTCGPFAIFFVVALFGRRGARTQRWQNLRRECELVRRGEPVLARVIDAGARSFTLGDVDRIRYEYDFGGYRHDGELSRRDSAAAGRLRVGDAVVVLIDPRSPSAHRRYDDLTITAGPVR